MAPGRRQREPVPPPPQCLQESYEDPRTEEEPSGDDEQHNGCRLNELAPEVARHHQLRKTRYFEFDSRRLHHSTRLLSPPASRRLAHGEPSAGRMP